MTINYQERFDNAKPSYIKVNDKQFADLPAGTTVLIPSPKDIASTIDMIPAGKRVTLTQLRDSLASQHSADGACPVMTGMNLRVVAEVSLDALDAGVPLEDVTPVWRAMDPNGSVAAKVPGGADRLRSLRHADADAGAEGCMSQA